MVIKTQRDIEIIRQVIWIEQAPHDRQQANVIGRADADAAVKVTHNTATSAMQKTATPQFSRFASITTAALRSHRETTALSTVHYSLVQRLSSASCTTQPNTPTQSALAR